MADPLILPYSLQDAINGHAITKLTHSVENWQMIGQWTADIGPASGGSYDLSQFPLGGTLNFQHLKKAVLMSYRPNDDWHYTLSGHDAGRLLDRIAPPQHLMSEGDVKSLITWLAGQCGVTVSGTGGLTGIEARALVSADKITDVIAELCQLSGLIPYIDQNGGLVLAAPSLYAVNYSPDMMLADGGMEMYLDDCALGVCVVLYRRKKTKQENSGGSGPTFWTEGSTPPGTVTTDTVSSGGTSYTYLQPLNVLAESVATTDDTISLSSGGGSIQITCENREVYDWDYSTRTYWEKDTGLADFFHQDNQEHREFKYWLNGYTKTQVAPRVGRVD